MKRWLPFILGDPPRKHTAGGLYVVRVCPQCVLGVQGHTRAVPDAWPAWLGAGGTAQHPGGTRARFAVPFGPQAAPRKPPPPIPHPSLCASLVSS